MLKRKKPSGFTCQKCSEDFDNWHEILRHCLKAHSFCLYCKIPIRDSSVFDHLIDYHCKSGRSVREEHESLKTKIAKLQTEEQEIEKDKADFLQMAVEFFKYKEDNPIDYGELKMYLDRCKTSLKDLQKVLEIEPGMGLISTLTRIQGQLEGTTELVREYYAALQEMRTILKIPYNDFGSFNANLENLKSGLKDLMEGNEALKTKIARLETEGEGKESSNADFFQILQELLSLPMPTPDTMHDKVDYG